MLISGNDEYKDCGVEKVQKQWEFLYKCPKCL